MAQLLIYGTKLGNGVHQIGITSRIRDVAAVERALRHAASVGGSAVEVPPEHFALAQRVLAGTGLEVSAISVGPGR